jgi:RNA polymerase sigma-70 factor (ECF subfamily)
VLSLQIIRQAMAGLSPEHREVTFEVYFGGRSCADTAALLNIPEGTVKSRTFLALRALRAAMLG